MANPSLQIGNGKWAIKEDNLLGYSTAGTRFVPQPITMTRATLGTRVNSSGLVEDVALLGSELVTNGDFATDTDWNKTGTWSIESNYATSNGNGTTQYLGQNVGIVNGRTYKITYSIIANTLSNDKLLMSGTSSFTSIEIPSSIGQNTVYLTASQTPSSGYDVRFANSATNTSGIITLDNVSVKEATIDNLPRVDYTDGTSSLLVEPQRTNLITDSEDFSAGSWTKTGSVSVSSNSVISPDGTLNGSTITGLTGSGSNDLRFGTSINPASTTYTSSVYLKGSGTIRMQISNNVDNADSTTITLSSSWVRYDLTHTFNATTGSLALTLDDSGGTASTYDIWGAQLEEGSYATSYIPTSGSTVTRNQETYEKTGISDKINSEEGVLFAELSAFENDASYRYMGLTDGSANNRVIILYYNNNDRIRVLLSSGGTKYFDEFYAVTSLVDFHKIALKWKINDFALWVDGVERATDTSGSTPIGLNTLALDQAGGDNWFGKVKQLQIFKTALTDSELATLTT